VTTWHDPGATGKARTGVETPSPYGGGWDDVEVLMPGSDQARAMLARQRAAGPEHQDAEPVTTRRRAVAVESVDEPTRPLRAYSDDELDPTPVQWLAPGWLPSGVHAVLAGDEGIGKSLLWVRWVAAITTGIGDPSINLPAGRPRTVLLILTEDPWGEVRERLRVAGADVGMVRVLCSGPDGDGQPILPSGDESTIIDLVVELDPALVVVDAWLDTVASNLQVRDGQHARQALAPWRRICTRTGVGVLLVTHSNRLGTTSIRDRMGHTAALRVTTRCLLFAATTEEERGHKLYVGPDKGNSVGIVNAISLDLNVVQVRVATPNDPGTTARLEHPRDAAATIQRLMNMWAEQLREASRAPSADERARAWVVGYLTDAGGQSSAEATKTAGRDAGHNPQRVAAQVKAVGGYVGPDGAGGPWVYRLPGGSP
jgi:hypothetical protein